MKALIALALFASPAFAQTPPPNWEMTLPGARHFAKDVCSERDSLRSDRACYAAYLRQRDVEARGYPPGDFRCTPAYQRRTRWEFYADDRPNCPNLRRPRR